MSIITNFSRLRVRFVCSLNEQVSYNVSHWVPDTTVVGDEWTTTTVAEAFDNNMGPFLKAAMPLVALYHGCDVQDVAIIPSLDPSISVVGAGPGLAAGDPLPPASAGIISFKTGVTSRSAQGRMFVPFPAEADSDAAGRPSIAYKNTLDSIGFIFVNGIPVTGALGNILRFSSIVWSRKLMQAFSITSATTRNGWGYQRRRGFFGTPNVPPF